MSYYGVDCPYCGCGDTWAEFVDVGVGHQQVTPYICENCGAYQTSPWMEDEDREKLSPIERKTGWYMGPPHMCPHRYKDVGASSPVYVCEICKERMPDFV
jgi:hypothetical protein